MNIYVLIMVISSLQYPTAHTVLQQDFSTIENCESARAEIMKMHNQKNTFILSSGCYKK